MDNITWRVPRRLLWAVVCGVLAAATAWIWFAKREAVLAGNARIETVMVATRDLAPGTVLRPSLLTVLQMPHAFVPPRAVQAPAHLGEYVATAPVAAGEVLTTTRLARIGDAGRLAALVPAGFRAVTIPVTPVSGVSGMVRPHDRVDLLAQFDFGTEAGAQSYVLTLLQGVRVLAVDDDTSGMWPSDKPGGKSSGHRSLPAQQITVAATPDDAQRIVFAIANGELFCSLVPDADATNQAAPLSPATAASVTGMQSLLYRREYHGR